MSAVRSDFEMVAGDAIAIEIIVTNAANELVDLSSATELRFAIRKTVGTVDLVIKTGGSGVTGSGSGVMTVQLETRDTFSILGANDLYSPIKFLHEAVVDMGQGEISVCRGAISIWPTIAKSGISTPVTFTYYVDPVGGNDTNDGLTPETAWRTTPRADPGSLSLVDEEKVGYLFNGGWALYRKRNMTQSDFVLPSNLYTASSDEY